VSPGWSPSRSLLGQSFTRGIVPPDLPLIRQSVPVLVGCTQLLYGTFLKRRVKEDPPRMQDLAQWPILKTESTLAHFAHLRFREQAGSRQGAACLRQHRDWACVLCHRREQQKEEGWGIKVCMVSSTDAEDFCLCGAVQGMGRSLSNGWGGLWPRQWFFPGQAFTCGCCSLARRHPNFASLAGAWTKDEVLGDMCTLC
jgi:hypothetical protein